VELYLHSPSTPSWRGAQLNDRRTGKILHPSILVGKPIGKGPLERPTRRWEDNIRVDVRETGCENVNWMYLAQDRGQWWADVNTVMNPRVP
jgi:hypothetical protein